MSFIDVFILGVHVLLAWILIELFVNFAHKLSRKTFVAWHYLVDVLAFMGVFWVYYRFFHTNASVFAVTLMGMAFVLFYELIVFRYLYSGERWFLNWIDWIVPMFLVLTSMYTVGVLLT